MLEARSTPWVASVTPACASAFGSLCDYVVWLTTDNTVPTDDQGGNAGHSKAARFFPYGINPLEIVLGADRS